MTKFEEAVRQFHRRDYLKDIAELNTLCSREPNVEAFAPTPPSILTGDPISLRSGGFLVLGINPGYPKKAKTIQIDVEPAHAAWRKGFDDYRSHRSTYFDQGDPRYNGRHFTRLGNLLANAFDLRASADVRLNAQAFFRDHAAISDLVPYWSVGIGNLELTEAYGHPAVAQWREVIATFVTEKKPRAIVVNGLAAGVQIASFLGTELRPIPGWSSKYGRSSIEFARVPVLVHHQLSARKAPSNEAYALMVSDWKRLVVFD